MRHRALPPAASPIDARGIVSGLMGALTGQRELERLKGELKDYFGVRHCFLLSSGKAAFLLILQALKHMHPERDSVLIPAFTCYSVPAAIVRAGLTITLCDVDAETLDFDFNKLRALLAPYGRFESRSDTGEPTEPPRRESPGFAADVGTTSGQNLTTTGKPNAPPLCIIATHLFGIPSHVERLRELSAGTGAVIVEDAAQAMGGKWRGRKLGTLGDVSFFSLGRGKAYSTVEGGIILTNRDDIAGKIEPLAQTLSGYSIFQQMGLALKALALVAFLRPTLFRIPRAIPFLRLGETIYEPEFQVRRMSAFQAGLARNWRARLSDFARVREANCIQCSLLMEAHRLDHYFRKEDDDCWSVPIRFPVKIENLKLRARILEGSARRGLGIMPVYPYSIDNIPQIRNLFNGQSFPAAKRLASSLITFPIHPLVSHRDQEETRALLSQCASQPQAHSRVPGDAGTLPGAASEATSELQKPIEP